MSSLEVTLFPQLEDNYSYILQCTTTGDVGIVDCPEAQSMIEHLESQGIVPTSLFLTHHHWDHIDGTEELAQYWPNLKVYGYRGDQHRLPCVTHWVEAGDRVTLGDCEAEVIFTPGHTSGHIAYYFASGKAVFCGDTLFVAGCGRVFEGTFAQMYHSIQTLAALPEDTRIYCGHEYTASNVRFALTVEPNNPDLLRYQQEVQHIRELGLPTIPSTIGHEQKINPFVRINSPAVQQVAAGMGADLHNAVAVFEAIRKKKDQF